MRRKTTGRRGNPKRKRRDAGGRRAKGSTRKASSRKPARKAPATEPSSARSREEAFRRFVASRGLRFTRQRQRIAEAFLRAGTHLAVEELYARVKRAEPRVGFATVYRTVKLLKESGLAAERHFGDRLSRYESRLRDEHCHLICTVCQGIFELEDKRLHALAREIARRRGFIVDQEKVEFYGTCRECRGK